MNFSIPNEIILKYINSDKFLTRQGNEIWIDSLYLFFITPGTFIGIFLNAVSIFVLFKINDKKYFVFKILKVYCFNSLIMCSLAIFSFYTGSPRYIGFKFDYFARIYSCIIIQYVESSLYYTGNILDIIISIERLSIFIPRLTFIHKINPIATYVFLVILCHIVNISTLLRSYIRNDQDTLAALIYAYLYNVYFPMCGKGILYANQIAYAITIILRDIITLIAEILFTSLSLYYFLKFQTKKSLILNGNSQFMSSITTNDKNQHQNRKEESRMTYMCLFLTIVSIFSHLACFGAAISLIVYTSAIAGTTLIMISFLAVLIKHSSNFLIFYLFNKRFKSTFDQLISKKSNTSLKSTSVGPKTARKVTFQD